VLSLSILFRTKGWLTLAQLVRAWAAELPGAKTAPSQVEGDLRHLLLEDIINGRLDESGPLVDGRRLGLRIITPEGRAGFLEGHRVHELTVDGANTSAADSLIWNRLVVLKEATLDFARRRELPPPSWWTDATEPSNEQTKDRATDDTTTVSKGAAAVSQPLNERLISHATTAEPTPSLTEPLKPAPRPMVQKAIKAVYDAAQAAGGKPPNIRELPAAVLPCLEEKGYRASARLIQQVGEAQEFKRRRRPPGKTVSSERHARRK
jgi:hypothetical protein